jgi:hypothetical protein
MQASDYAWQTAVVISCVAALRKVLPQIDGWKVLVAVLLLSGLVAASQFKGDIAASAQECVVLVMLAFGGHTAAAQVASKAGKA